MKTSIFILACAAVLAMDGNATTTQIRGKTIGIKLPRPDHNCRKPCVSNVTALVVFNSVTTNRPTIAMGKFEPVFFLHTSTVFWVLGGYANCHLAYYFVFPELRTPSNVFLFELAISDLLFLSKILPPMVLNSTFETLKGPGCKLSGFLDTLGTTSFLCLSLAIAGERYFHIFHQTNYFEEIRWKSVSLISLFVWLISLFVAGFPFVMNKCWPLWVDISIQGITQFTPVAIVCALYIKIWMQVQRSNENENTTLPEEHPMWEARFYQQRLAEMRQRVRTATAKANMIGIIVILRALVVVITFYFNILKTFGTETFPTCENTIMLLQIAVVSLTPFVTNYFFNQLRVNASQ